MTNKPQIKAMFRKTQIKFFTISLNQLLILVGIMLVNLSMPNGYCHLGWLAWCSFTPLFYFVFHKSKTKFLNVWIFFQLAFLTLFFFNPLTYPQRFESMPIVISLLAFFILFPILMTIVVAVGVRLMHYIQNDVGKSVFMASIWVLFEYILTFIPYGFPISVAISQYQYWPILQICQFTGIYGITFAIIFCNCLISLSIQKPQKQHFIAGIVILGILIAPLTLIKSHANPASMSKLALIQPNISYVDAWYSRANNLFFNRILNRLSNISQQAELYGIPIVFPELSIIDFSFSNPSIFKFLESIARQYTDIIIGIRNDNRNSVAMIARNGKIAGIYDKQQLVPFFETNRYQNALHHEPLKLSDEQKVGVLICYETLFPQLSRRLTRNGAHLLGGVSFNTWLGNSNWPWLHMAYLPFRAIENQRPAFFLNNNGPSITVNQMGRISNFIPINKAGYCKFQYYPEHSDSPYSRYGDLFVLLLILTSSSLLFFSITKTNNKGRKTK